MGTLAVPGVLPVLGVIGIALLMMISSGLIITVSLFVWFNPPRDVFFNGYLVTSDKTTFGTDIADISLISQPPRNQPFLTPNQLLTWANECVGTIYTFNFGNTEIHFKRIQPYFTTAGWQAFLGGIQQADLLKSVINNRFIVSARTTRPPTVIRRGVNKGIYTWEVQVPVLVRYQAAKTIVQRFNVNLIIIRTPLTNATPRGVAIAAFNITNLRQYD